MNWEIIATVIVALISFAGTGLGVYFSNRKSSALFAYRLERLEEEVRKHNQVIERTGALEKEMAVIQEDVRNVHENIKKLEEKT